MDKVDMELVGERGRDRRVEWMEVTEHNGWRG